MEETTNKHAGFWVRLVAYLIDGIILATPFTILNLVLFGTADLEESTILYILFGIVATLYMIILPVTSLQATLGKRALKMKILNYDNQKITIGQSIGRYFSQVLSYVLFFIGYLMIAFTKKKTGLHDILAKTYVVYRT